MKAFFHWIFVWLVMLLISVAIFGTVTMLLWNWLMPDIFGLPTITLLQAYGLCFLANFLFCNKFKFENKR